MPDAGCSHGMAKAMQRDIWQTQSDDQGTMRSIEAGWRQAANIPTKLPIMPEPEHETIRNGQNAHGRGRFGSTINNLAGGHALALIAD